MVKMETATPKKLKDVFSKLQDDESRQLFEALLMRFLDGDSQKYSEFLYNKSLAYEQKPDNYERSFSGLKDKNSSNPRKIVLFGAGVHSWHIARRLKCYGINADCYCDSNPVKQNTKIWGLPVISP